MTALYNEYDPYAAQWLRNLIVKGLIAPGDVAECSIEDLTPNDIRGYTQFHAFAGVGVWSLALRRAGFSDDRPVWTMSCPCQPFSAAGKGEGFADERHLWPAAHWLIEQCRPPVVIGEQVASKDGLGWLDLVQADLEGTGYASRAVDLCAAGIGAPHIRQRLWWVGERMEHATGDGRLGWRAEPGGRGVTGGCGASGLGNPSRSRTEARLPEPLERQDRIAEVHDDGSNRLFRSDAGKPEFGGLADADGRERDGVAELRGFERDRQNAGRAESSGGTAARRDDERLADPDCAGAQRQSGDAPEAARLSKVQCEPEHDADVFERGGADHDRRRDMRGNGLSGVTGRPGPTNGHWRDADWLFCRDGKWRPVKPGTFPLVDGSAFRVDSGGPFAGKSRAQILKGAGNAIVADCAQAFIESYLDSIDDRFRLTDVSLLSGNEGVFG